MELSRYSELFRAESREHISALNHHLLAWEADPAGSAPVEGVFRAVHTIKGMAATMGYAGVAGLAHEIENLLDALRGGEHAATTELLDLCFAGADALESAIELAIAERGGEFDATALIARLRAAGTKIGDPGGSADHSNGDHRSGPGEPLRICVIVDPAAPLAGVRALLALRRARDLGEVDEVEPAEAVLGEEEFAGELHFVLRTGRAAGEVHEALWAVGELKHVRIRPDGPAESPETISGAPQMEPPPGGARGGNGQAEAAPRHMRVELTRLDSLMDQIGELVIVRDRLQKGVAAADTSDLSDTVEQAARLISELQDQVMRVRMVPVWQVFDRFPRLVRDAAHELGKRIDFVIEGRDIEFDRSMLDELVDAVVHLLRNAVDHGIETPGERQCAGKPEVGTLRLYASRERDRAIIRVEDDGRGIDRTRIRQVAAARGAITSEAATALNDDEVLNLLTRSGFSTADRVTDVSGRGVGLDVVATRVRSLGGALAITSEQGSGTCFTLRLPLTLAVVRVLLVRIDQDTYALPLLHVSETAEFLPEQMSAVGGRSIIRHRDELIPIVRLRTLLRYADRAPSSAHVPIVILEVGEQVIGLEVDALIGQREIVVKNFDGAADTLRLFSGATILSDGRPALILDAGSLLFHPAHAV